MCRCSINGRTFVTKIQSEIVSAINKFDNQTIFSFKPEIDLNMKTLPKMLRIERIFNHKASVDQIPIKSTDLANRINNSCALGLQSGKNGCLSCLTISKIFFPKWLQISYLK